MRLVKIGLASVNKTVGAFAANVDRAIKIAGEMAADGVTLGVFQEQLVGGLSGRGPDPVAGVRRAAVAAAGAVCRGDGGSAGRVRLRRLGDAQRAALQLRRAGRRRARSWGWCRRRSCRPTTSTTKGGRFPGGCRAWRRSTGALPFGDMHLPVRFRDRRGRGLRGPLERGRADQAADLFRRGAERQPLGLRLPGRDRAGRGGS